MCASHIPVSMICLRVRLILLNITATIDFKINIEDVICYTNNPFVLVTVILLTNILVTKHTVLHTYVTKHTVILLT